MKATMAINKPYGDGHRQGSVRDRSQVYNPHTERYVKRDRDTGLFMDMKSDKKPFKGRVERRLRSRIGD